jgi:hypothetical protein
MLKKKKYIGDLNDEEIEFIKKYKCLFKRISKDLEDIDL